MHQTTSHYSHETLKRHARRLFAECRKSAKAQGFTAELIGWGIDVSNQGVRLRVEYLMGGLKQHATEIL